MGKLEDIIANFAAIENVKGVVVFGSYAQSANPRDIDVMLILNSKSFLTQTEDYRKIASVMINNRIFPPLDVVIKTNKEFEDKNVVSLSRGFLQHLKNVGRVVYSEMNLKELISKKFEELKESGGYWNEVGDSLSIRKNYLMSLMGQDYNLSHKFYQQAVREVLKLDFSPELDSKEGIIKLFYDELFEKVDYAKIFGESPEFTIYRVTNAFKDGNITLLKSEIETAMFALNLYLVSQQSSNLHP